MTQLLNPEIRDIIRSKQLCLIDEKYTLASQLTIIKARIQRIDVILSVSEIESL